MGLYGQRSGVFFVSRPLLIQQKFSHNYFVLLYNYYGRTIVKLKVESESVAR